MSRKPYNLNLATILLAALLVTGCASRTRTTKEPVRSACTDPLFLELQHKPFDSLSGFEKAYFEKKYIECSEEQEEIRTRPNPLPYVLGSIATGILLIVLLTL